MLLASEDIKQKQNEQMKRKHFFFFFLSVWFGCREIESGISVPLVCNAHNYATKTHKA